MADTVSHSTNPSVGLFSCNTCGIRFTNYEGQKYHMKSEWHRYNLKRRVAQLPTISAEVFVEKVQPKNINNNSSNYGGYGNFEEDGNNNGPREDEYGFVVHNRRRNKNPNSQRQVTKKDMKRLFKSGYNNVNGDGNNAGGSLAGRLGHQQRLNRFDQFGNLVPGTIRVNNSLHNHNRSSSPASTVASEFSEFSLGDSVHSSQVTETESIADTLSNVDTMSESGFSQVDEHEVPLRQPRAAPGFSDSEIAPSSEDEDTEEEEEEDNDDDDYDDYDILAVNGCIYCNAQHDSLEDDIQHMFQKHGLYIPNRKNLKDLSGLIQFLWEVISIDNVCLNCGFIGKTLESIQDHCISKAHCRIPYEHKEERELFAEFYEQSNDKLRSGSVNGNDEGSNGDVSNSYSDPQLDDTGSELALPSGYKIGHRSMMRYYRQTPRVEHVPRDSESTVVLADKRFLNNGGLSVTQYQKQFSKMLKQNKQQENVANRRAFNSLRKINYHPHLRDPNLP